MAFNAPIADIIDILLCVMILGFCLVVAIVTCPV